MRHDDWQPVLLHQNHTQPVRKFETLGDRQGQFPERLRAGSLRAPRFVGHGVGNGFALGLRIGRFFRSRRIVDHAISGQSVNHDTGRRLELVGDDPLQIFDRGTVVAIQILGQIPGIVEKLVVLVQSVRKASEAAKPLQPRDDSSFNQVASPIQFRLGGPCGLQLVQFFIDGFLEIFGLHARLDGGLQLKNRPQSQALVRDRDLLRDLFFVDERLV